MLWLPLIVLFWSSAILLTSCTPFCESKVEIPNGYPFKRHKIPFPMSARFYKAPDVEYAWHWLISNKICGTNSPISDLIDILNEDGCDFVFWGNGALSIALQAERSTRRLTALSTCGIKKIVGLCESMLGGYTSLYSHGCILIGNPLSVGSFSNEFTVYLCDSHQLTHHLDLVSKFSYDVLEMGVFRDIDNNIILADTTGHGVNSLCKRSITTTHPLDEVIKAENLNNSEFYDLIEVAHLITRRFSYLSNQLHGFVERTVAFSEHDKVSAIFFCENFYDGLWLKESSTCELPDVQREDTKRQLNVLEEEDPSLFNSLKASSVRYLATYYSVHPVYRHSIHHRTSPPGRLNVSSMPLRSSSSSIKGGGDLGTLFTIVACYLIQGL